MNEPPNNPPHPTPERLARTARKLALRRVQTLRKNLARLDEAITAEKNESDAIHAARVATRRLRAAIELIAPLLPPKKLRRSTRALRRLIHGLGDVRDIDVQLGVVEKQRTQCDPKHCPAIERLVLRLTQRRERLRRHCAKVVRKTAEKNTLAQITEWLERAPLRRVFPPVIAPPANTPEASPTDSTTLVEDITAQVRASFARLLSFDAAVYVPGEVEKLHEMRIAAKRLRYTIELVRPVAGKRFDAALDAATQMQELLGELHDCDVWLAFLPRFVEEETERTAEYFGHVRPMSRIRPGIEWLIQNRRQARQRAYRRVVERWREAMRENAWAM